MDQQYDPRKVFMTIHHKVTGDLLHLMDGFYSNIEDGLFELAYRYEESEVLQRRYFDLMREMRFRRSNLIQAFAKRMQQGQEYWFGDRFTSRTAARDWKRCGDIWQRALARLLERTSFKISTLQM